MTVIVDSKGNTASIEYADLPSIQMPSWSFGINKLFDFLEKCERESAAVPVADSRIGAMQIEAVALSAGEV